MLHLVLWVPAHYAVPSNFLCFIVAQHHGLFMVACSGSIPICAAAAAAATRRLGSCRPLQILDALHQLRLAAADRGTARSEHILQCSHWVSRPSGRSLWRPPDCILHQAYPGKCAMKTSPEAPSDS